MGRQAYWSWFLASGGALIDAAAPSIPWPRWRVKLLGITEVLGALGLIVPGATGLAPALTPVAALCLAVLMAGAIDTHRRLGERFLPASIVGALCLLVAVGHSIPLG